MKIKRGNSSPVNFLFSLNMISLQSKLPGVGTNIFSVMSKLAAEHGAINLSQGFPDFPCDPKLISTVKAAYSADNNQYAPMPGTESLRAAISQKTALTFGKKYDAEKEITVTAGATQAIFTALAAVINPGDEVIIFEPAYDCYAPVIKLLGGLVKPYEMQLPDYSIDWEMVKMHFSANTKMIILNTPHNPTGTILKESDMQALIKLTKGTDILILSDEVYEHLIFNGQNHLSVALYPELRNRSFIVASFGKILHATGWKIGYCLAPEILMTEFRKVHQFNVFSVNTPLQNGIAKYISDSETYLGLSLFFQEKRDFFREAISNSRFTLLPNDGTYFQCVSYESITDENDMGFAKRLITEIGVAGIPVSAFYMKGQDHRVLRFCFAKSEKTLASAVNKLKKV